MMKRLFVFLYPIIAVLLFIQCSKKQSQEIRGIIDVVRLQTGKVDTFLISDLFYAPKYDLKFSQNKDVKVKYNLGTKQVIFSPAKDFSGLTIIKFQHNWQIFHFPVYVQKRVPYTFRYKAKRNEETVQVIGSFNTWNRRSKLMEDPDGDRVFEKTFWLENGRYEYRFYVNGKDEIIDPVNRAKVMNSFGQYNSLLVIDEQKENSRLINKGYNRKENSIKLNYRFEPGNNQKISVENIICLRNNTLISGPGIKVKGNTIQASFNLDILPANTTIRVAVMGDGFSTPFEQVVLQNGVIAGSDDKSFSWYDAIVYSIIVDRFYDGDTTNSQKVDHPELKDKANYYGGDLQGVIQKLDEGYFSDLGVNVLWLSPVNQNPMQAYQEYPPPHRFYSGYHGYWPIDPKKVDVRFGDMELLKNLIEKAHSKGMKIILDFVSNHVHEEHPYFKEHRDWFGTLELPDGRKNLRLFDEFRLSTWFEPYLPSFDFQNSRDAIKTVTDDAVWWLKETNADGFRQDAVKHVPFKFWRTLTKKIKKEIEVPQKRKIFQIGETFGSYALTKSYVNNGQLDAQFNFNLYNSAMYTFLDEEGGFEVLNGEMQKTFENHGMFHFMGNLMDSHDKMRFLAAVDGDVTSASGDPADIGWNNPPQVDNPDSYKMAQVYLAYIMTIPGIPFVYYGDEIGMTGSTDPDNRRPMRFGDQLSEAEKDMNKRVKKIVALRRDNPALRYGDFMTLHVEKDVWAYARSDMQQQMLVILNKSNEEKFVGINLPAGLNVKSVIPLMGVKRYTLIDNILDLNIAPLSAIVFQLN
ncbi:MAG: hypothetical protein HND50_11915 [Calditrichaeota bacterium]|nr:hypothetical protein [Calditrichota bacterium]